MTDTQQLFDMLCPCLGINLDSKSFNEIIKGREVILFYHFHVDNSSGVCPRRVFERPIKCEYSY